MQNAKLMCRQSRLIEIIAEGNTFILHLSLCILHSLQTRIDIRGNIPDVVLHIGIVLGKLLFHLLDRVQNRCVIPVEHLADLGRGQVCQLTHQIHRNLPGFHRTAVSLGSPQGRLVHGVELAHLADDQFRGGQGVALAFFEHIVDGPGNIG